MADKTVKFTLTIEDIILKRFRYIAEYNARSANRELEVLIKKYVEEFEKKNGPIKLEQ